MIQSEDVQQTTKTQNPLVYWYVHCESIFLLICEILDCRPWQYFCVNFVYVCVKCIFQPDPIVSPKNSLWRDHMLKLLPQNNDLYSKYWKCFNLFLSQVKFLKQRGMVAVPVFFSGDQQAIIVAISSTGINEAKDGSYLNAYILKAGVAGV